MSQSATSKFRIHILSKGRVVTMAKIAPKGESLERAEYLARLRFGDRFLKIEGF